MKNVRKMFPSLIESAERTGIDVDATALKPLEESIKALMAFNEECKNRSLRGT